MKRHYDSDEDDYYGGGSSSKANYSRKLDLEPSKSKLKFVSSESGPSTQTYGLQEAVRNAEKKSDQRRPLTDDEKNALAAKILKAELSGKMVS